MATARRMSWMTSTRWLFAISILVTGCNRANPPAQVAEPAATGAQAAATGAQAASGPQPRNADTAIQAQPAGLPSSPTHEAADPTQAVRWAQTSRYKLRLTSDLTMTAPDGTETKLDAKTSMRYTWKRRGEQADLLFHSVAIDLKQNGMQTMLSEESRNRFRHKQGGDDIDLTYDQANPELQQILAASFDVVLLTADVDANGRVLNETVVAGPNAQAMLENGVLVNARLFQAPYYPSADNWQAPCKFTMGGGQYATGKLTYQPAPDNAGEKSLRKINVMGEASGAGKLPSGAEFKDALYRVNGWQTMDAEAGDWRDGKWTVDVSFDLFLQGQKISTAAGTIVVSLEREAADSSPVAESPDKG